MASVELEQGRGFLSNTEVERYHRDGFLFPLDIFSRDDAGAWTRDLLAVTDDVMARHPVPWTQKTYLLLPFLDEIIRDPRLTGPISSILGDDILALSADVFIKKPHTPKRITWHQDVNYWGLLPMNVLTAWIAFTDATRDNGCMRYVSGEHRARLDHVEKPSGENMLTRGQEISVTIDETAAVPVELRAGQASLHHGLTPHASGPNETDDVRIGFAIRYVPTHVRQTRGPAISARLVRGTDGFGHFALEDGPDTALSEKARELHIRALTPHKEHNFSTV